MPPYLHLMAVPSRVAQVPENGWSSASTPPRRLRLLAAAISTDQKSDKAPSSSIIPSCTLPADTQHMQRITRHWSCPVEAEEERALEGGGQDARCGDPGCGQIGRPSESPVRRMLRFFGT